MVDCAAVLGTIIRVGTGMSAMRTTPTGIEFDVGSETDRAPVAVVTAGGWVR